MAAPLYHNLAGSLAMFFHWSLPEIEATQVKLARQLLMAAHESAGNVKIWTEADYQFEDMCRAADARKRQKVEAN
jgi:hypothetical protein